MFVSFCVCVVFFVLFCFFLVFVSFKRFCSFCFPSISNLFWDCTDKRKRKRVFGI